MTFNYFLKKIEPFLIKNNINFGYQRKNCKKHGHYKKIIKNDSVFYEIKIEKDDNDAGKIYTLIHELTHCINNHLDEKKLTVPQKEMVCDQVSKYYINKFNLHQEILNSKLHQKFNILLYSAIWMKNRNVSDEKMLEINRQIENTIKIINSYLEVDENN